MCYDVCRLRPQAAQRTEQEEVTSVSLFPRNKRSRGHVAPSDQLDKDEGKLSHGSDALTAPQGRTAHSDRISNFRES